MIGTIHLKSNHTLAFLLDATSEDVTEFLVSHSLMAQLHIRQSRQFLVGIINIRHLVHHPCTAIDIRISDGHCLPSFKGKDEILGVEHVEHGEYAVTIHLGHIALGLADR